MRAVPSPDGSSRAFVRATLAALALLAAFGAADAAATPKVRLVEQNRVVQPNSASGYATRCPRSRPHPVGAEIGIPATEQFGQIALAASYPQGRRGWFVAVQNLSAQAQGYFSGIICLASKAKFAYPRTTF